VKFVAKTFKFRFFIVYLHNERNQNPNTMNTFQEILTELTKERATTKGFALEFLERRILQIQKIIDSYGK
jgi:hypothetical protein